MSDSLLRARAKDFAKKIVFLCADIKEHSKISPLVNQLLRSGTSVGTNIYEAQYAQGKKERVILPYGSRFFTPCNYHTGYNFCVPICAAAHK